MSEVTPGMLGSNAGQTGWRSVQHDPPTRDQPVQWLTSTGETVDGHTKGRLWFFADWSMYVYYTPAYWRPR
jgi:hypothetical protein